jgi:hypothetical protein
LAAIDAAQRSRKLTELSFDIAAPFFESAAASMKLLSAFALLNVLALVANGAVKTSKSGKPSGSEESIAPTTFVSGGKPQPRLISSDLNGRELQFITSAVEARSVLVFLARHAAETQNPNLRALGEELQKNLPHQTAVLTTLAEMRKVPVPETSPRQQALEKKFTDAKGARLEKLLLDALLEANQELVTTCEIGQRSTDKSVQQFAEQTLPYAGGTLSRVQAMAGIAPKRAPEAVPPPIGAGPQNAAPKPGFRTNIPASGSGE